MPLTQSQKNTLATLQKRIVDQKAVLKQKRDTLSRLIKSQKNSASHGLATTHIQEQVKNSRKQDIFRTKQALESLQLQYTAMRKRFRGK